MTSDTGDKGSGPHKPPHSGRRAPTIDLKAKEVASEAVPPAKPSSSEPADTAGPAAAANPGKGAPQDAKPETDAGGVPPRAPGWRWPAWDSLPGRPSPLFGAAIAAAIVFFVLGFITASFFSRNDVASDTRLERIHADERLTERLTKIEASLAAPRSPDAGLLARIATAEAAAKLAAETAAAQQRRAEELAALVRETRSRADAAAASADAAQRGSAAAPDAARLDVDALLQRIAALEQALKSNEAEMARRAASVADDRKSRVAVVASVLLTAVERGSPFAAELAAAKSLAPDAPLGSLDAFAAAGLPGAVALSRELAAQIPAMLKLAQSDAAREGGFLDKLQANAERLVRIRPVGEIAGDRPVDVIARIESRVNASDVPGALQELGKLPPQIRAPADAWIAKANARNAALTAARQFSIGALAAIGKPNT